MRDELIERSLCGSIIACFFEVYNYYGFGLSESVYAKALEYELRDRGHTVLREVHVAITYKGNNNGTQRLDMVVDDKVIVENKASELLSPYAKRQLLTYLRATIYQVGLLLYFGPEPKFFRRVDTAKSRFVQTREDPLISRDPRPSR